MTEARRQRLQELFDAALKRPPEDRASFVAEACGDDAELRAEAESLQEGEAPAGCDLMRPPDGDPDATRPDRRRVRVLSRPGVVNSRTLYTPDRPTQGTAAAAQRSDLRRARPGPTNSSRRRRDHP